MKRLARPALLAAAVVLAPTWAELPATAVEEAPDLVLLGGRIFTADPDRPWAEALAVRSGRVVGVGRSLDLRSRATRRTRVLDVGGRVVIPGLNDAHVHLGYRPAGVTLPEVSTDPPLDEVVGQVRRAARRARAGTWIYGTIGTAVLEDPSATAALLDGAAPVNPVFLTAVTGHGALFNGAARRALGVAEDEEDPPGGWFTRIGPTPLLEGLAHEYAGWMLARRLSLLVPEAEAVARVQAFSRRALQLGITSVQDMPAVPAPVAARHIRAARSPLRWRLLHVPLADPRAAEARDGPVELGDPGVLRIWGRKWILDGTAIERLAAMREPYADQPEWSGRLDFPEEAIGSLVGRALLADEPFLLHVAGERTAEVVLDAMARGGLPAEWRRKRLRFEHGDGLNPDQIRRAARMGVVVVQNPSHFTLPEVMAARLGAERVLTYQPLRSLLDAGVPVALGSDGPLNPYLNVLFAVTHPTNPAEAITREEAFSAYTRGSAYAEFAEEDKGTLAHGQRADLAVLSHDPFQATPADLPRIESVLTLIGGRVVYDAGVIPHPERSAP